MNYKIFQICFEKDQLNKVDPLLTPFDNTENEKPELREYHNFLKLIADGHTDDLDAWGMFGPRWEQKMRHDSKLVFDTIENNPGNDIYLFNHARIHEALTFNVWEQGELFHKGIRSVASKALEQAGYDPDIVNFIMVDEVTCYCSYFVATKEFWKDYLEFLAKIKNELENLPDDLATIYYGSANYGRDLNLNMFPFIVERMLSTFLVLHPKYKIHARKADYTLYENALKNFTGSIMALSNLKKLALKHDSSDIFNQWDALRDFFIKMTPQLFNLD
jgi:hypothetical protein